MTISTVTVYNPNDSAITTERYSRLAISSEGSFATFTVGSLVGTQRPSDDVAYDRFTTWVVTKRTAKCVWLAEQTVDWNFNPATGKKEQSIAFYLPKRYKLRTDEDGEYISAGHVYIQACTSTQALRNRAFQEWLFTSGNFSYNETDVYALKEI
jgi:hypothetical protein